MCESSKPLLIGDGRWIPLDKAAYQSRKRHTLSVLVPVNVPAWRYYSRFYRGSHRLLLLSVIASIMQSLILLSIALLVRHVFDDLIPAGNFHLLALVGTGIVFLYLINGGITLWTRHVILKTTKAAIQRFRGEMLGRFYAFSRS